MANVGSSEVRSFAQVWHESDDKLSSCTFNSGVRHFAIGRGIPPRELLEADSGRIPRVHPLVEGDYDAADAQAVLQYLIGTWSNHSKYRGEWVGDEDHSLRVLTW